MTQQTDIRTLLVGIVVEEVKKEGVFVECCVWDGRTTAVVSVARFTLYFCSYLVNIDGEYRN